MALSVFPILVGARFEETSTTALFRLGEECQDSGGGRWVYVKANGAITQYDAVKIDNDYQAYSLTTTIAGSEPEAVGIAQVAFNTNEYGWVFSGPGGGTNSGIKVRALTLCATDVKLYTTATAGCIDDTATTQIQGLTIVSTNATGGTVATELYAAQPLTVNS